VISDTLDKHNITNIEKSISEYSDKLPIYQELAERVRDLIIQLLKLQNIQFYDVQSRAKSLYSFSIKTYKKFVQNDYTPIQDMAGIRIIAYTLHDVERVSNIVEEQFKFDESHVEDKSKKLGKDKVGYLSTHYIASFSTNRLQLIEYSKFENLFFEIQVRTVLQHAWAQITHDSSYKSRQELPDQLYRRFNLLAGNLELLDNNFQELLDKITQYSKDVSDRTRKKELDIPINVASVKQFLTTKFGEFQGVNPILDHVVIGELLVMKIFTLEQLDRIIPSKFKEKYIEHFQTNPSIHNQLSPRKQLVTKNVGFTIPFILGPLQNYIEKALENFGLTGKSFSDLIRIILIISDVNEYFQKAWKGHFMLISPNCNEFLKEFNIDPKVPQKYIEDERLRISTSLNVTDKSAKIEEKIKE
jgi:ppGpp synthetase/RelA/SpoT-type nucleotidyltranferase